MLVDHLFQYRISPWPKTSETRGICTGVTDRQTDGPTDGQTLLQRCEDASENKGKETRKDNDVQMDAAR